MNAPSRPIVGLLGSGDVPPGLRRTLLDWSRTVELAGVRTDPQDSGADAFVVWGPYDGPVPDTAIAVWVDSAATLQSDAARRADVLMSDRVDLVEAAGDRGVLLGAWPVGSAAPVSPWVRSRIRAARGLPSLLLVRVGADERLRYTDVPTAGTLTSVPAVELPLDAVPSALACASAAVVTGADLLRSALAWGTPTVTDPGTAVEVGARDGAETVVVAGRADQLEAARDLGDDLRRAARIGWAGRRLVERSDPAIGASDALRRLLPPRDTDARSTLDSLLDELGTPATAAIRTRAEKMVAGLPDRGVLR